MFDDPTIQIQQLTALIKDDITSLNMALQDLQTLQNLEMADGGYSEDRAVHSTTVCDDLKNKLMGTAKQFQDVLTTRTQVRGDCLTIFSDTIEPFVAIIFMWDNLFLRISRLMRAENRYSPRMYLEKTLLNSPKTL